MSWVDDILSVESREVAVAACYFVARELKQLTIPSHQRKDPLADAEDSRPSIEARETGERILLKIKEAEGEDVLDISEDVARKYLRLVVDAGERVAHRGLRQQSEGKRLLEELRSISGGSSNS